jgi:hypothetical protein
MYIRINFFIRLNKPHFFLYPVSGSLTYHSIRMYIIGIEIILFIFRKFFSLREQVNVILMEMRFIGDTMSVTDTIPSDDSVLYICHR